MKVCLIRPPRCLDKESVVVDNSPALGLAFIAGALKQAGHEITVIDAIGENPVQISPIGDLPLDITVKVPLERLSVNGLSAIEIAERIPPSTEVIGISAMFSNNWLFDRYLIDFLGERFPDAIVIAGGESITAMAEIAIRQTRRLAVCVLGEGEETIVELLANLVNKKDLADVNGIAYRCQETGQAVFTTRRTRLKNVDEIPLPAWEYFPVDNYQKYEVKWGITKQKSLPLLATRGCPYSCTFCSSPQMWGTRYYMREPMHIIKEMEYLMATYGITNFDFYDLTAILKKSWIIEFTNEIIQRKLDITWELPVGTRSEVIDDQVAHNLYLSGCRQVTYAPETGSNKMLKLIKKKVKISNMLQSMRYSYKEKMFINLNMIIGLPDETHADLWHTIWFLLRTSWIGVHGIAMAIFQPYPGSALFSRLVQEKKIDLSNDDFFLSLVFMDSYGKGKYYNTSISPGWYQVYDILTVLVFYGSNFLFHPIRFYKLIRNLVTYKYENRMERNLAAYLKKYRVVRQKDLAPQA